MRPLLHRIRPRLNHATVVAYLALFVALGGGALAASGGFVGPNGELHGCVDGLGRLTVLKPGKSCGRHRTAVAWSTRGPQGAKGTPGGIGAQGLAGPQGAAGAQGAEGDTGSPGPGAKQFEVKLASGAQGVVVEVEGAKVEGDCEKIVAAEVGLETLARGGVSWSRSAPTPRSNETGFVLDATEVNLDILARAAPVGKYSHVQVVGVRVAGGCQFSGVVTPAT